MSSAELLFDWLRESDPITAPADVVIGFGHFDLRIPELCAQLVQAGMARRIVFTGGIGAGTGNLGIPEADAFSRVIRARHPDLADRVLLAENTSTNTSENIRFTTAELEKRGPDSTLGGGIRSAILVAHAPRLRRVRQSWKQLVPGTPAVAVAPETTFALEEQLYREHGIELGDQVFGELARLRTYPGRGWIAPIDIPAIFADLPA